MIREISYQVSSSGITPYTVQNAGVQGEQNVTRLSFSLDSNLLSKLTEAAKGATLYYRFDIYDSLGCSNSTEPIALEESQQVYYDIGLQLSAVGGNAKVYLVITAINEDKTEAELISVPALINFTKKAGAEYDQLQKESLSALYAGAVKNAQEAKASEEISTENAEAAEAARRQTENARFALEKGAEFVFQGGNAEGSASVQLVVDSELSVDSTNPIQNQAVAREFKQMLLLVYPVGSIYMSMNSTSPADLFGGTWERIKDRFLLSCGDIYEAGATGGEAEHILTVKEMPSHAHNMSAVYAWRSGQGGNEIYTGQAGNFKTQDYMTSVNGEGKPHNNMPPYLTVYMWKRIA